MNFTELKNWITNRIQVKNRNSRVVTSYLLYLMTTTRKHTFDGAKKITGIDKSLFSRLLKNNSQLAGYTLDDLSKKQAKQYSKIMQKLGGNKLPWKVAILIDATLHPRSTRHTENSQKHNHGQGYVVGHQWTNILLIINDMIIPLPPIPFYTHTYCRKNNLKYKTEHEAVVEYITDLKLEDYIGVHNPKDIVVIADSGYDCINIENAIVLKKWNFIIALKAKRGVQIYKKYLTAPKPKDWIQVADFFKKNRWLKWITIRFFTNAKKKKRMDFRIRHTIVYLRYVEKIQLVCSEFRKRPDGRRKYLACNDLKATARQILLGYKIRWSIEIFHKDVKQYLGFEDVGAHTFEAVTAHVHWVYCAYILLTMGPPGVPKEALTIREKQLKVTQIVESKKISEWRQILTQFKGSEKLMNELYQVIQPLDTAQA